LLRRARAKPSPRVSRRGGLRIRTFSYAEHPERASHSQLWHAGNLDGTCVVRCVSEWLQSNSGINLTSPRRRERTRRTSDLSAYAAYA
jgi:hypothetical protein